MKSYGIFCAAIRSWHAVLIDSVQLWGSVDAEKLSEEERQALTSYLYKATEEALRKDYRIAEQPGPGVMRLRAAITEAEAGTSVRRAITTVMPPAHVITALVGNTADSTVTVGSAGLEAELLDSLTDVRLGAVADRRAGTKANVAGITEKLSDVYKAMDFWTERLSQRLAALRRDNP